MILKYMILNLKTKIYIFFHLASIDTQTDIIFDNQNLTDSYKTGDLEPGVILT